MSTTKDYNLSDMLPGVLNSAIDAAGCRWCMRNTQDPIAGHDGYCPVPALFTINSLRSPTPAATVAGWRLLEVGEVILAGDECWSEDRGVWIDASPNGNTVILRGPRPFRRRLTPPAQGWRLLEVGEVMQAGDEFLTMTDHVWEDVEDMAGTPLDEGIVRRRLTPPAQGGEMQAVVEAARLVVDECRDDYSIEGYYKVEPVLFGDLIKAVDALSAVAAVRGAGGEGDNQ